MNFPKKNERRTGKDEKLQNHCEEFLMNENHFLKGSLLLLPKQQWCFYIIQPEGSLALIERCSDVLIAISKNYVARCQKKVEVPGRKRITKITRLVE